MLNGDGIIQRMNTESPELQRQVLICNLATDNTSVRPGENVQNAKDDFGNWNNNVHFVYHI